jgi:hypothetical protein
MNESDFENLLRSVPPAAPHRCVEERIATELNRPPVSTAAVLPQPSRPNRFFAALGWASLGATLAVASMLTVNLVRGDTGQPIVKSPAKSTALIEAPVEFEHEILEISEGGIVAESADGPARIVRYDSLERRTWTEPSGAVMILEVPREDLVLMPISYQ